MDRARERTFETANIGKYIHMYTNIYKHANTIYVCMSVSKFMHAHTYAHVCNIY